MTHYGIAVVGAGFIGPVHVEGLRQSGLKVVGILGSTAEKSRQSAESLGVAKTYENSDQLLADGTIHSVHIATPNRLHYEMASKDR